MLPSKLKDFGAGMFLSGVESDKYWDIVVNKGGIRNVLTTYYYFRKQPKDTLKNRLKDTPDVRIFIDSGAFTFKEKGESKSIKQWESYIESYVEWARLNKDYIIAIANLDIESLVGEEKVLEWNKKYFEPLEAEGVVVCYIWHPESKAKLWKSYCHKYDYIGLSSEIMTDFSESKLRQLMNIAAKTGTIVHGMGFTKTRVLVKIPLYSFDSTTWLVGQKYGELNWFDGRRMRRLKKIVWQRRYKTRLIRPPFNADWDLLINGMDGAGDTYELLRLNVIAYKIAQDHIQKRLGNQQYWLKGRKVAVTKEDINKLLPSVSWFEGDMNDYATYASGLRISSKEDKETTCNILKDFRTFICLDASLLSNFTDDRLMDNCLYLAGETAKDPEEALDLLHDYYRANAEGRLSDFSGDDENSINHLIGKERESYVEEDESYETDISEADLSEYTALPPPSSMPEVDAYDKELSDKGIVVKRDSGGKFVKGNKVTKKSKTMYSDKYPKLLCNTCYKSGDCPEYQAGYVCAYDKMFSRFDTRKASDVIDAMSSITDMNLGRLQKAMLFETLDGGMPTVEVNSLIDQNIKLLEKMKDISSHTPRAILNQRTVINADGSSHVDTLLQGNPTSSSGGVLGQLFSKYMGASDDDLTDIDADEKPSKSTESVVDVDFEVVVNPKDVIKPDSTAKKKLKRRGGESK